MPTVQTNVRVLPGDKPLLRAVAAKLRGEPRFRDRLAALLAEDPSPALQERIETLEAKVGWLLSGSGDARTAIHALLTPGEPMVRPQAANGGSQPPG